MFRIGIFVLYTFQTQALHLLEFLELNTILGASHFTFYNHTLGSRASCVLKHYMNGDFLTGDATNGSKSEYRRPIANQRATINVLPWDLRMRSQKDIRTEGLFAALNDCVYRNMYRYRIIFHFFLHYPFFFLSLINRNRNYPVQLIHVLFAQEHLYLLFILFVYFFFLLVRFTRYQHLALIDLDEFIIPRYNNTLSELLT